MGRTFTVGELIDRVRSLGDYLSLDGDYSGDAPSAPSSGSIIRFMDVAHRRAWEDWSRADEGWNVVRITGSTVVGQSEYPLPDDFHRLRAIQVQDGIFAVPGWRTLQRANLNDDTWIGDGVTGLGAYPVAYRLLPDTYELLPTVGVTTPIRISYTPVAARLSSSLQTVPGTDGFDEVVVYRTLVMTREREEKDTSEFRLMAQEVEARFMEDVRRRDRANPMRMRPRGSDTGRISRRRPYSL